MDSSIFRGLVTMLIGLGISIGFVTFIVVPWLWRLIKPWIHAVTG